MILATITALLLATLSHLPGTTAQSQVCNNAAALCSRNYNSITHLGAHDSPFVRNSTNSYSVAGNQFYTTLQQLSAGIRLVTAQIHQVTTNGQTDYRLCHSLCQLYDAGSLADWLSGIKGWLDQHPNDVVNILLVNSDNTDAATLGGIYQSAGVAQYSYQPASTTQAQSQWPTLSDLISQNKRLVNFIASLDPATNQAAPYLLDEFTFVFENDYDNVEPTQFSCEPNRPPSLAGNTQLALSGNYMPLMNHFLYDNVSGIEIPSVQRVNATNAPSGGVGNLGDSAANCSRVYGRAPTFILTDFTNVGPAIDTVDRLNGVSGQTGGRLLLPDSVSGAMSNPSPTALESSATVTNTEAATATSSSGAATASVSSSDAIGTGAPGGFGVFTSLVALAVRVLRMS